MIALQWKLCLSFAVSLKVDATTVQVLMFLEHSFCSKVKQNEHRKIDGCRGKARE